MASKTVIKLCSSFSPKLATVNSPTPTLLPLPPGSFSCSSSLPTPHVKASFEGIRVLQTSQDFKCYASADESFQEPHQHLVWGQPKRIQASLPPGASATSDESGPPAAPVDTRPPAASVDTCRWQWTLDGQEVLALGKYVVNEYNRTHGTQIQFQSVVKSATRAVAGIILSDLSIRAEVGFLVFLKPKVDFGPVIAKDLKTFAHVECGP